MLKFVLQRALASIARAVVKKYRPKVVGITGSVGKTSTKEACAAVLSTRYRVGSAKKNYNNELGVPLTILGEDAPGRSILRWLGLFFTGFRLLLTEDALYPQVLVLELGADHPGDLAYLLTIAPLDVAIITAIGAAHTEYFGSIAGVLTEKKTIAVSLSSDKIAILNGDDSLLTEIRGEISARIVSFGFSPTNDVQGRGVQTHYATDGVPDGVEADVFMRGEEFSLVMSGVLGRPTVYAALAAVAVGQAMDVGMAEIQLGLATVLFPPGRMRIIPGIKGTLLIDDTYNSSPTAAAESLSLLESLHAHGRRIAILGDMLELGALTEIEHRKIGLLVAEKNIDVLYTVGGASHALAAAAREAGMEEYSIYCFDTSAEAGRFLQDRIQDGDIILIKGSQGTRMERIVKEVMAEPLKAEKLLVRQGKGWVS